jgi:hypothetical protein
MGTDQTPGSGEFILYPNIPSPFLAGSYKLTATQTISANGLGSADLPIDPLNVHFDVRSPRLVMPPDQVLSVFPPAESEGAYGSRLPQVVIKRRTLPWERRVAGALPDPVTPFVALVVVADGEGTVLNNVAAAETLSAGRTLVGAIDSPVGTCLEVRQSMVHKIFPTQLDVPLLAHARLVDISDTELMMGDDDGFLAVVVANRLPMAAADGTPVKYTACLVNLESQWDVLLPKAPAPVINTVFADIGVKALVNTATMDQHRMGGKTSIKGSGSDIRINAAIESQLPEVQFDLAEQQQQVAFTGFSAAAVRSRDVREIGLIDGLLSDGFTQALDPMRRFPVLLSWRFTTSGNATFKSLMEGLDSQLLGSTPKVAPKSDAGRLPLEIVDTGHVGLAQRTRRGDSVRAWYRGPFVPHPTDDSVRLALAHAADQLRIVVPDGREDLSLASAFEIGRLLALANPNMVAALLRWRQMHYAVVRQTTLWQMNETLLQALNGFQMQDRFTAGVGVDVVRALVRSVALAPETLLGKPRVLADPGRPLPFEDDANKLITAAFGLPALRGGKDTMLATLQDSKVRVAPVTETVKSVPGVGFRDADRMQLDRTLGDRVDRLATDTIVRKSPDVRPPIGAVKRKGSGKGSAKTSAPKRDALDALIDRMSRASRREAEDE